MNEEIRSIRHFNTVTGVDVIFPYLNEDFGTYLRLWKRAHRNPHFSRITNDVVTYKTEKGETIILAINSDE